MQEKVVVPPYVISKLKIFMTGYERSVAQMKQTGDMALQEGHPVNFSNMSISG